MRFNNFLSLQEAVVLALIHRPGRIAHIKDIFEHIKNWNLYNFNQEESFPPFCEELKLFFDEITNEDSLYFFNTGAGFIQLKDTHAQFPSLLWQTLKDLQIFDPTYFDNPDVEFFLFDVESGIKKKGLINPADVVCIVSSDKEMRKDFYLLDPYKNSEVDIGKFSLNDDKYSMKRLLNDIDPKQRYLALISKNAIVNADYFELSEGNKVKPLFKVPENPIIPDLMFSGSTKAKDYRKEFERVKNNIRVQSILQNLAFPSYLTDAG